MLYLGNHGSVIQKTHADSVVRAVLDVRLDSNSARVCGTTVSPNTK